MHASVEQTGVSRPGNERVASVARAGSWPALTGPVAASFARQGGVVSAEDAALLMRRHCEQPVSQLARWIVGSHIVHFNDMCQTWIPLFQFYLDDMSIRPEIGALLAELAPVMEGDELAHWFVTANDWLAGASPLETLEADFSSVLEAARADRFVTAG